MSKNKDYSPENIVKALRICRKDSGCVGCPLRGYKFCVGNMKKRAADLIEEQQREIERLQKELILKNDELLKYQEEQRWIPVTERLPEHNKPVLVYCENLTIQGGYTVHIGSCDTACGGNYWFLRTQPGVSSFPNHEWRVTHWKPMPRGVEVSDDAQM